jgi:hypothetical protein
MKLVQKQMLLLYWLRHVFPTDHQTYVSMLK